jgi:capsular polysaccharide biosynthesis protein
VILGCALLGALAGGVITVLSPNEYTASSTVYIGQTTDANGNPMAGLNSNARSATQLLASEGLLSAAAEQVGNGLTAAALAENTTVETPTSTVKNVSSAVNLVVISVTDQEKTRAAAAANALAGLLLENIASDVNAKIGMLEQQLEEGKAAYAEATKSSKTAQAALRELARQSGGRADEAAAAPYLAIVQAASSEQQALQVANQETERMLLVAKTVELPRILHDASVPSQPSGPDLALNVAAGAVAGFVVGVILAFVRRRLAERA